MIVQDVADMPGNDPWHGIGTMWLIDLAPRIPCNWWVLGATSTQHAPSTKTGSLANSAAVILVGGMIAVSTARETALFG